MKVLDVHPEVGPQGLIIVSMNERELRAICGEKELPKAGTILPVSRDDLVLSLHEMHARFGRTLEKVEEMIKLEEVVTSLPFVPAVPAIPAVPLPTTEEPKKK
jgi:hypothetical protein